MVKQVKADFGSIDALVNNAGITRDKLLARMGEDDYDAVIAVNQKSVYNMTKHVCSIMMKQRSGRIVNVASVAGLYGNPGQMNYSRFKGCNNRHDKDNGKGVRFKKHHLQRCCARTYQNSHDRCPFRRAES